MFGAKLITPFGLIGRFAHAGLKQRLREHYNYPSATRNEDNSVENEEVSSTVRMNELLLDCVIDMGLASAADGLRNLNHVSHSRLSTTSLVDKQEEVAQIRSSSFDTR
ncbi:hypothetical protein FRC12_007237 [Ceratobasidium sp. 428]|nr:hypothetical protein FRC12_007237 [Ceratobasidium sp. 428]